MQHNTWLMLLLVVLKRGLWSVKLLLRPSLMIRHFRCVSMKAVVVRGLIVHATRSILLTIAVIALGPWCVIIVAHDWTVER